MSDSASTGSERTLPSEVAGNVKTDVSKRIPQMEQLRRGNNTPGEMHSYLSGYIDAHYQFKEELEKLETLLQSFDKELRDLRKPTCYHCGSELAEEWKQANEEAEERGEQPAECPHCGKNPLPPVGSE